MLIKSKIKIPNINNLNKKSNISSYYKNVNMFRFKHLKTSINKPHKSFTLISLKNNNIKINPNNKTNYSTNSSFNFKKDFDIILKKQQKTQSYFYSQQNRKMKIKLEDNTNTKNNIIKKNKDNSNIINIINFSKISSFYKTDNHLNNNSFSVSKPETKKKLKRNKEFNSIEKNILKIERNMKDIKREYKPNLREFYINNQLKNYIKKSSTMLHVKNDLNSLYRNSYMLNNICDIVGNALFVLRIKKRNIMKKINNELNQKKDVNKHKNLLNLKIKNKEIPDEKIFIKQKYATTENLEFYPRLKAKLIYQNCYPSNSIKYSFDRYTHKKQLNLLINNNKS